IAEADAMGNATAIRGYGPFGENGTMVPNRFGYTGQQYIAGLGLYYYKARWYSPTMGRFLETDPIGYGDGVNWYAYVGNNPVNLVDPDGKLAFFWHAGITYAAARDSGRGFVDSLALAWNTMMVDKGTQSTAAIDANIHAMLGTIKDANGKDIYQTGGQGLQAINGIIANAPLPTAIHTTQDAATPDHYLKPWEGAGFNWDTITHLVHDTFPSVGTITNAYSNTMNVLSKPIAQQGAVK
ncbi:MAG: RHS repeat-associated core domain-containing protein, partial [Candidatus Nitrotoga sp.]